MYQKETLSNGLRIITHTMPHARSAAITLFIGAGSRYEEPEKGGVFHVIEMHPFCNVFDNETETKELQVRHSYFHKEEPTRWDDTVAYADKDQKTELPSYEWVHSMSDIVNALIAEGLVIEHIHEFPFSVYDHFSFMRKSEDGWYRFNDGSETIPLLFSLKARG